MSWYFFNGTRNSCEKKFDSVYTMKWYTHILSGKNVFHDFPGKNWRHIDWQHIIYPPHVHRGWPPSGPGAVMLASASSHPGIQQWGWQWGVPAGGSCLSQQSLAFGPLIIHASHVQRSAPSSVLWRKGKFKGWTHVEQCGSIRTWVVSSIFWLCFSYF